MIKNSDECEKSAEPLVEAVIQSLLTVNSVTNKLMVYHKVRFWRFQRFQSDSNEGLFNRK